MSCNLLHLHLGCGVWLGVGGGQLSEGCGFVPTSPAVVTIPHIPPNAEHIEGSSQARQHLIGLRDKAQPLNQPLFMALSGLNQQEQELGPGLMGL